MQQQALDSFLVSSRSNVRYLSGFSGSAGLLWVNMEQAILYTDFRYEERAQQEASACDISIVKGALLDALVKMPAGTVGRSVGFESAVLTFKDHNKLSSGLRNVRLLPTESMVEELLEVKDEDEVTCIRQAVKITDQVFEEVLSWIKPGISEREIAAEIEYRFRKHGGEKASFDTIVASGKNGSMPHAAAGDKQIDVGDFVTLDMGTYYKGYASDLTRTVVIGTPTARQKQVYATVLSAQQQAIEAAKAGMIASELDAVARNAIAQAGLGGYFGHGLGHGVGLLVHDPPRVSWMNHKPLKAGMVVTIEPGVYIPGWGGVRIEDIVIIKEDGCEDITSAPKALISV